MSHPAVFT